MYSRVPVLYYLLTGITGLASMLVCAGWFRQLTLLFGTHLESITSIMAAALISLSIGSSVFGRVADRSRKPLHIYIILISVTIIFVFFHKPLLDIFSRYYIQLVKDQYPGRFEDGLLKFLLSFTFFLIPLSFLSGQLPLLVRHFIRNINLSGQFMSATFFPASTGIVAAILLSVFLLVPHYGIDSLMISGGLALIIASMIVLFRILTKKNGNRQVLPILKPDKPEQSAIRFRKKKIVIGTGARLTRAMLYGSAFQVFSFSALLVLCFRILPFYSVLKPVFFYSAVLVVTFTGIAAGSALYRYTADRPPNKYLTLATFQIIAGIVSILSLGLLRMFAPGLNEGLTGSASFTGLFLRHAALFSLLLFIPSFINGMSLPLAGRLYPKKIRHIGKTFGQLGGLIFLSLLAGILFTPYILIPITGIQPAYLFLSSVVLLSGVYLVLRDSRLIRGFRVGYSFTALLLFVLFAGTLRVLNISRRSKSAGGINEGSTLTTDFKKNPDQSGSVFINGTYYFGTDPESKKEQILTASIPAFLSQDIQSALLIGFGTGITASVLNESGVSDIHITEVSPEIVRLSSNMFSEENNYIYTGSGVEIGIEDARSFLFRSGRQFDLITCGSEQTLLFPGRYTLEFYRLCYDKLTPNGIYSQVLPVTRMGKDALATIYTTCDTVFGFTSLWSISSESVLMIGSKKEIVLPDSLAERVIPEESLLNKQRRISTDNFPITAFSMGH